MPLLPCLSMCLLLVSLESRVRSNMLGYMSNIVLLICKLSLILYSVVSGVKSLQVV